MMTRTPPRRSLLVAALAVALGGCVVAVGDVPKVVRSVTYPPDFRYLERREIQGAMWQLALASRELHDLIHASGPVEDRREAILARLRSMEAAAEELDSGGRPTNHPLLEWHLPRLIRDIELARSAVEGQPPSYLQAATVAGACLPCHSGSG